MNRCLAALSLLIATGLLHAHALTITLPGGHKIEVPVGKRTGESVPSQPSAPTSEGQGASTSTDGRSASSKGNAKSAGITYDDALQCAGLIEIGNLVKTQGHGSDPRLKEVQQPGSSNRFPVWDKMIALHPKMKSMSEQDAESMRAIVLNKYIGANLDKYEKNIDMLRRDYLRCGDIGVFEP